MSQNKLFVFSSQHPNFRLELSNSKDILAYSFFFYGMTFISCWSFFKYVFVIEFYLLATRLKVTQTLIEHEFLVMI